MLNRKNVTRIRLGFDDLSGFLIKRVKGILRVRDKDYVVRKGGDGGYVVEFQNPVSVFREDYDKFADLLTRLGFVPAEISNGIYRYINDDNVTVSVIYNEDENGVLIRKIMIGNTVPGHIGELIKALKSFGVSFEHVVVPMTHVIKVSGVLGGVNGSDNLEFYHNSCVKIGIRDGDGNRELEITDICDSVTQKVKLPKGSGFRYSDGTLVLSLPHT